MASGSRGRGADYMPFNTYNGRALTANEAWHLDRATRARLSSGQQVGWEFEALALFESGCPDAFYATGTSGAGDADLHLMYVRLLLREAGEATIPEPVYDEKYDLLVG